MSGGETPFRKKVLKFLKTLKNTKHTPIQQMSFVGDPDYILCIRGQYFDLELKDTDGVVSIMQEFKMGETRRCGGATVVASPENWENVKKLLTQLDQGEPK